MSAGEIITQINDTVVDGLTVREVVALLQSSPRPLDVWFEPAPEPTEVEVGDCCLTSCAWCRCMCVFKQLTSHMLLCCVFDVTTIRSPATAGAEAGTPGGQGQRFLLAVVCMVSVHACIEATHKAYVVVLCV